MENSRQLVQRNKVELSGRGELSPRDSALMNILNTTAQTLRAELTPEAVQLWKHLLEPFPIEEIRSAFLEHIKTERFFPLPAEILTSIAASQRYKCDKEAERQTWEEKKRIEAARAAGQLVGIAEIRKALMDVVTAAPQITPVPVPIVRPKPFSQPLTEEQRRDRFEMLRRQASSLARHSERTPNRLGESGSDLAQTQEQVGSP